jgi:hypothetical protein
MYGMWAHMGLKQTVRYVWFQRHERKNINYGIVL